MNYYAVIDTNVIVSSMLKRDSIPGMILDLIMSGTITPLLNEEIFDEYSQVLLRNKFGFNEKEVSQALNELKSKSIYLDREHTIEQFIDEDDIVFYEIVMSARKQMDAYLVTGNIKHFPIKNFVVTPREMLDIISKNLLIDL